MNDEQVSTDTIKFPTNESNAPKRQVRHVTTRHYFVLDGDTVRSVDQKQMEAAWRGEEPWHNDGEVRILTVLNLKPDNIVVKETHASHDHVTVLDFGLARVISEHEGEAFSTHRGKHTRSGHVLQSRP